MTSFKRQYWAKDNNPFLKKPIFSWILNEEVITFGGLPRWKLVVKNPPANAVDVRAGSNSGSGRSPGGGHGNPLQYSCLEKPGGLQVTKSQT